MHSRRGSNQFTAKKLPENFPDARGTETRDIAAEKAGFGNGRTYQQAKVVVEHGTPELVAAVPTLAEVGQPYQSRPTGADMEPVEKPAPTLAEVGLATRAAHRQQRAMPLVLMRKCSR